MFETTVLMFPSRSLKNWKYGVFLAVSLFCGGCVHDIIPNKFKLKIGAGIGFAPVSPKDGGNYIGSEINFNLLYRPKVFMDLELHAAYLKLGNFFDSPVVNGENDFRPKDPWTFFLTLKWIMF